MDGEHPYQEIEHLDFEESYDCQFPAHMGNAKATYWVRIRHRLCTDESRTLTCIPCWERLMVANNMHCSNCFPGDLPRALFEVVRLDVVMGE